MGTQNYAVEIEKIMRNAINCERSDMGGLVESNYARKHPFTAMMSTIMLLCDRNNSESIEIVSDFFAKFQYYGQWNIDEMLRFKTDTQVINGCECKIEYTNGEEAVKAMIGTFDKVCTQLK